jgi:hypothetical protein
VTSWSSPGQVPSLSCPPSLSWCVICWRSARRKEDGSLRPSDVEALVTLGVDTHADVHVGVPPDRLGRRFGSKSVPTTEADYAELVAWAQNTIAPITP